MKKATDRLYELIRWNRHAGKKHNNPKLRKLFTDTADALEKLFAIKTSKEGLVN